MCTGGGRCVSLSDLRSVKVYVCCRNIGPAASGIGESDGPWASGRSYGFTFTEVRLYGGGEKGVHAIFGIGLAGGPDRSCT
eukprot:4719583-Prymnesium_polylepis.1